MKYTQETFLQERPTLKGKRLYQRLSQLGKGNFSTPASCRVSVSHKRKKNSQQGSRVQENRLGTLQPGKERRGMGNAKPMSNTYKGFSTET